MLYKYNDYNNIGNNTVIIPGILNATAEYWTTAKSINDEAQKWFMVDVL